VKQATVITKQNDRLRPIRGICSSAFSLFSSVLTLLTHATVTTLFALRLCRPFRALLATATPFHGLSPVANNAGPSRADMRQSTVTTFPNNRMRLIWGILKFGFPMISSVLKQPANPIVITFASSFFDLKTALFRWG